MVIATNILRIYTGNEVLPRFISKECSTNPFAKTKTAAPRLGAPLAPGYPHANANVRKTTKRRKYENGCTNPREQPDEVQTKNQDGQSSATNCKPEEKQIDLILKSMFEPQDRTDLLQSNPDFNGLSGR
jgi:hypothetical protein